MSTVTEAILDAKRSLDDASRDLASIMNPQTIAEQQRVIVERDSTINALRRQVQIERDLTIAVYEWLHADGDELVVYYDDTAYLAWSLIEEQQVSMISNVVRDFIAGSQPLPHYLCQHCKDLECGHTLTCSMRNTEGAFERERRMPKNLCTAIDKSKAVAKLVGKGTSYDTDYLTALEMLDECRAALSIEVEDAGADNFAEMCQRSRALSNEVDALLESVGYGDMPRVKDLKAVRS